MVYTNCPRPLLDSHKSLLHYVQTLEKSKKVGGVMCNVNDAGGRECKSQRGLVGRRKSTILYSTSKRERVHSGAPLGRLGRSYVGGDQSGDVVESLCEGKDLQQTLLHAIFQTQRSRSSQSNRHFLPFQLLFSFQHLNVNLSSFNKKCSLTFIQNLSQ